MIVCEACTSEIEAIIRERKRQDAKWGEQNHGPFKWLSILLEEAGEAAKAALEDDRSGYIKELTEVAAVAVAAIDCERRKLEKGRKLK